MGGAEHLVGILPGVGGVPGTVSPQPTTIDCTAVEVGGAGFSR